MSAAPADPVALAQALIRAQSVTPAGEEVFEVAQNALAEAGFETRELTFGDGESAVRNLFATRGEGGRHIALAGHVDVVPPGAAESWTHPPFSGLVEGDTLHGRGAQDMKGGIAAMIAAATRWAGANEPGRVSFLITGDEEGPAVNGTRPLVAWCAERYPIDAAIVGEPTCRQRLGDTVKVGRRGSVSGVITVTGRQGHVAYQEKAHNPVPELLAVAGALLVPLDAGTDHFAPSNLEITSIDIGNEAFNVIPAAARLRLNVRINDLWSADSVKDELAARVNGAAPAGDIAIDWRPGANEPFLTRDEALIERVSAAVEEATGVRPEATTGGGTSDARFIKDHCPVVEFGAVGDRMHQVDERTSVAELTALTGAYEAIIRHVLAP